MRIRRKIAGGMAFALSLSCAVPVMAQSTAIAPEELEQAAPVLAEESDLTSPTPPADPAEIALATRLGIQALRRGEYEAAAGALGDALMLDPMDVDALVWMGELNRAQNKKRTAMDYYQAALAVDPADPQVHAAIGQLYLDINRPDRAEPYLQTVIDLCPFGCAARQDLTRAYEAAARATQSQEKSNTRSSQQ